MLGAQPATDPADLYANHRWFELREVMANVSTVPSVYRAALACAFHDTTRCETDVRQALVGASADREYQLREFLNAFYFRAGRYQFASRELRRMAELRPGAADVANALPLLVALSRHDDQATIAWAPSSLPIHRRNENFPLPLTINGAAAHYFFDTGANVSVMTEAEAKRLHLTVYDVSSRVSNTAGDAVVVRVATAEDLVAGGVRLKNVAFLVFRDDQEPFRELPLGSRGAIGLPVLLAFGTFSWGIDTFEIGDSTAGRPLANLCFDGALPIVRLSFEGTPLVFNLDTGAEETMLWPPFATAFADLIGRSGRAMTTSVNGVGSSVNAASRELPRVDLTLGGRVVRLAPASVLLQSTTADTRRRFGNLGLDLLNQAARTTISFRSMSLALDGPK